MPPSSLIMGGALNCSHFSPLTLGGYFGMGGHVGMGGHAHSNHPGLVGGASNIIGSSSSVVSSVLHLVVPASSDLSLLTSSPSPAMATTIKDKLLDMVLKEITDKDSWMDAKKVSASFWPGPSKELVTTPMNATVSAWWEELIVYYCKPPISDLFVEELRFDKKSFEMIAYTDTHFNPSGVVDYLGYIFVVGRLDMYRTKVLLYLTMVLLARPTKVRC
jgi:hypothetical protein